MKRVSLAAAVLLISACGDGTEPVEPSFAGRWFSYDVDGEIVVLTATETDGAIRGSGFALTRWSTGPVSFMGVQTYPDVTLFVQKLNSGPTSDFSGTFVGDNTIRGRISGFWSVDLVEFQRQTGSPTYPVRLTGGDSGAGTVTSSPEGINCAIMAGAASGACIGEFEEGSTVTLTAEPGPQSMFIGWVGGDGTCNTDKACQVSVDMPWGLTARFSQLPSYDPGVTAAHLGAVNARLDLGKPVFDALRLAGEALQAEGATVAGTGTTSNLVLPGTLVGRTLVWDPAQQRYVVDPDANGAPTDGVRFVYYASDAAGQPSTPLEPLGYIDFADTESGAEGIGVRVVHSPASTVLADYVLKLTPSGNDSEGSLLTETAGSVNGMDLFLQQGFLWNQSENSQELDQYHSFTTVEGKLYWHAWAQRTPGAETWSLRSVELRFFSAAGDMAEVVWQVDLDGSLTGEFRMNSTPLILMSGTESSIRYEWVNGRSLTSAERSAVEAINGKIPVVFDLCRGLVVPTDVLSQAG